MHHPVYTFACAVVCAICVISSPSLTRCDAAGDTALEKESAMSDIQLQPIAPPPPGQTGYIGFEMRVPWMEGHVRLRMPETLSSTVGLHFIDHNRADMPPLSIPNPFPEWQRNDATGEISYEMQTDEGMVYGGRAWPEGETVRVEFRVRNASDGPMNHVHNQQCLVMTPSPDFGRTNSLDATYTWVDGKWTCLDTTTPSAVDKGRDKLWILMNTKELQPNYNGPMEIKGAWWVVNEAADDFIIARESEDRKHLLAIAWYESPTGQIMSNTMIPCLHAGPGTQAHLEPGDEHVWRGCIFLMENDPEKLRELFEANKSPEDGASR
jgi:hypothetical protein